VLSEYGISQVSRPVHLNRIFREKGWIQVKDELGLETLDCGGCQAFAVADHQVAHVYVNDPAIAEEVRGVVLETEGVEEIREGSALWGEGMGRERGGDFVAVSEADAWFTYYFWQDDAKGVAIAAPMRGLMDVIPLDANLVKGSHGRDRVPESEQPVAIGEGAGRVNSAEAVFRWIRDSLANPL